MHVQEQTSFPIDTNLLNKQDNLINHIDISVSESEKRTSGALNLRDYYTVYLIETKVTDPNFQTRISKHSTIWKRYTEFEQLREYLEVTYPYIVLPPLPEKRVMFGWQKISNDTFDPNFIDRRRAGLENFLLRVASHEILSWDKHFLEFLLDEEGWRESYKANGYLQLVENKLKNISLSIRLKKPDAQFEMIKDYSSTLHGILNNLLKARCKVAERQYTVHKLNSNYGRVFSEWSANEKEMGDALQKTGHYLDSLASCIDAALEDEELLADQLKEYLFFANSLQSVCRNREMLQLQLEDSEENVSIKNVERTKVQQGKSGLMSRLFGAIDTDEVRELKITSLDQQIQEGAVTVNNKRENLKHAKSNMNTDVKVRILCDKIKGRHESLTPALHMNFALFCNKKMVLNSVSNFTDKAIDDIERFQNQKVVDLTETLASYAFLQLKTAKKGLQTWTQIRDCLQNIP